MLRFINKIFKEKTILFCLVLLLAFFMVTSCGEEAKKKTYTVGILSGLDFIASISDGFKAGMSELGYKEGDNITYDIQKSGVDFDAYKKILKGFVDKKVDLIVAFPTEASIEAKAITKGTNIPVAFTFASIEGMDIVDSIKKPGGNITGVRYPGGEILMKRWEIMNQMVPKMKKILIPYMKGYPIVEGQMAALKPLAEKSGIKIDEMPATTAEELTTLLAKTPKDYDFIFFVIEPLTVTPDTFTALAKFAYANKIPIGGAMMSVGDYNCVFGVNVGIENCGKETAPLADKILKGAVAGEIPVVTSEMFLEIHTTAASKLGVTIPETILRQANTVLK
ncbi:MAG: ABC transporter substrate-binding protein [Spirochaetales bacterium]|nr:ABC transporter substrate-binding protein [Spirochaetales bacterium]